MSKHLFKLKVYYFNMASENVWTHYITILKIKKILLLKIYFYCDSNPVRKRSVANGRMCQKIGVFSTHCFTADSLGSGRLYSPENAACDDQM